ncbi:MAG: tetratricopeptide repeat protein [Bacteroidota bacterium]
MKQKKQTKTVLQKQNKQKHIFKPNLWFAIISAVVGFCLYFNTIKHEYVLDDVGAITSNPNVTEGISGIPKILNVGMWHFDNVNLGYYRPLSMITFAVENEFFQQNPHVSHLGNVILYALTGFFLCLLLMKMFRNFHPIFSFIVTLLFISHPIHTEVVANIKSRDEILAFLNLTIALLLFLRAYKNSKINFGFLISSSVFFFLALLSKETSMTGLIIAPLILFFTYNFSIKQCLLKAIPFLVMIFIFQILKYEVLGTISGTIPKDIVNYPYAEADAKISSVFLIFVQCVKLILLPHPLSYDYSYNQIPAASFFSGGVWFGILLSVVFIYFCFKKLLKKSPLTFGVLFFCITLAPALAFVFLRGGILAERFLYAPSLGFCIIVTWLLGFKLRIANYELRIQNLKLYIVHCISYIVLFLLYSFKTITRNSVWHDNMTLFSTDINASPNSCQVWRHCGSEIINLGITEKNPARKKEFFENGTAQLRKALKINPHFGDAFFKMGVAYQTVHVNNDSAIFYYTRAIQEAPGFAISYNNLGILYETTGKQEIASYYYNKAVEVNPYFPDGIKNHEAHKKRTGLDIKLFPTSINPDSVENSTPEKNRDFRFYYKLGTDYASRGDYTNAARCLEKSTKLNSSFIDALVNLSNCYGMLKNYNKNIEVLNKVLAISPNNVQAISNLAVTYELLGDKNKAEEYRERAKEIIGK